MAKRNPETGTLFAKPAKPLPITAPGVLELLRQRHADDVFIPECKTGPSMGAEHSRFDAWVMRKSWSNAETIGYEIKVSRGDFLRDGKWQTYLPFCNTLYFVAPRGIILPSELPESVGLLNVTDTGARLMTARRAVYRHIEEPGSLFRYVLMCRAIIGEERAGGGFAAPGRAERTEQWRRWLGDKASARDVGHMVSKGLSARIYGEMKDSIDRAREAERRCESMAERLGLLADIEHWISESGIAWQLRNVKTREAFCDVVEAKTGEKAAAIARSLKEASDRLARLAEQFQETKAESEATE